jgi:hypothetical protein
MKENRPLDDLEHIRLHSVEMEDLIKQILKYKGEMKFIRKPVKKLEEFFAYLEMNPKEKCLILDTRHGPDTCGTVDSVYCKAHEKPCSLFICFCKRRFENV